MKFLRCFYPSWNSLKWTLRLFEVVISRTGLSLVSTGGPIYDVKSTNPFRTNTTAATDYVVGGSINTNNLDHEIEKDILGGDTAPSHGLSRILVPESDEVPSFVMGFPAEGWLQDLLDVNFSELNTESMA